MISKIEARQLWKQRRAAIPTDVRQAAAQALADTDFQGTVASFVSFGTEIDTALLNQKLACEHRLALPRIVGDELYFFHVNDLLEPPTDRPALQIDTLLVPGLAFSSSGFRLGYGRGFYDRFLSKHKIASIGIGFLQQLTETILYDPFDQPVRDLRLY